MLTREELTDLHEMMPGKESVRYYVRKRAYEGYEAPQTVEDVETHRPLKQRDRSAGGFTGHSEQSAFHFWTEKLCGIVPAKGDKFTLNDETWHIDNAAHELMKTRWRILATKAQTT